MRDHGLRAGPTGRRLTAEAVDFICGGTRSELAKLVTDLVSTHVGNGGKNL